MRRSLLVVTVVVVVLGTVQGLVVNYASEKVPAFFTDDPWRPWLILALIVAGLVIAALVTAPPQAPETAPPPSREARRRAKLASVLWDDVHSLAVNEEWRDSQFTELEAEVEVEAPARSWLRRRAAVRVRRLPSLTEALRVREDSLVVLEGEPGAGKSIALRHLAATMADEVRRRPAESSVLPFYLNLKNFDVRQGVSAADVERFVRDNLNPSRSRDIDRYLEERFDTDREQGRWLFLFDSFDEIPAILSATEAGPVIDAYVEAIAGFVGLGQSRAVIASREFRGPTRSGKPLLRVMPLSRERRERFIRNADLDAAVERTVLDGLDGMELQVQQLTDNPLFLSLFCEYVRATGSLPSSTHAVMESYVRTRLSRDRDRIEYRFAVEVDLTRRVAEEMAFVMLTEPDLGLTADRAAITGRLAERAGSSVDEVDSAIEALLYSHLLRYTGARTRVTFSHRRLQEYFATCAVIRDDGAVTPAQLLSDGRWRETAVVILQTQRAELSTGLLSALEQRLLAADESTLWPPGTLYLLDLMADALTPEEIAQHPVSEAADRILARAWERGTLLDRKWVVELCAAAGAEKAVGYLAGAFAKESVWLRDEAYRQVRRVGPAAARLEPEIRQTLIDLSLDGRLWRERRSTRIQMQRLPSPGLLPQVADLLLAAPVAALVAGPLGMALIAPFMPGGGAPWLLVALAAPLLFLGTWAARLFMASTSGMERHVVHRFGRYGIGEIGVKSAVTIGALFVAPLALTLPIVPLNAAVGAFRDDRPALGTMAVASALAALWLWLWPFGALSAARWKTPAHRRSWVTLPYRLVPILVRESLGSVRRRRAARRLARHDAGPGNRLTTAARLAGWLGLMAGLLALIALVPWALFILAVVPAGLVATGIHRVWQRHRDRRTVSSFVARKSAAGVPEIQRAFDDLRTDAGVHLLVTEMRRHGLHRNPELGAFLSFLVIAFDSYARFRSTIGHHPEWDEWWRAFISGRFTMFGPSSETVDELGRMVEEAKRDVAFHE
ncbi:NACHT domain-containing protein [Actinoplanes sp. NPDC000266]